MKKRIFSLIVAIVMIAGMIASLPMTASAKSVVDSGRYYYAGHKSEITWIFYDTGELRFENASCDDGNYWFGAFFGHSDAPWNYLSHKVNSISFDKSIEELSPDYILTDNSSLTHLSFDDDHPRVASVDGVAFDKSKTVLKRYPQGRKDDTYTIPYGTTTIQAYAFDDARYLKRIVIPNTVTKIGYDPSGDSPDILNRGIKFAEGTDVDVYYTGTYEEWNNIDFENYDKNFEGINIHFVPQLATPNVWADKYEASKNENIRVSWNAVPNADFYTVHLWDNDGEDDHRVFDNWTATELDVSYSKPGTWAISVYARSYDNTAFTQSEPASFNVNIKDEVLDPVVEATHDQAYQSATQNLANGWAWEDWGETQLFYNGEYLENDVKPQIIDGRTMVPMRAIFEALGAEITWNAELRTVTAVKGDTTIILTVGDREMITTKSYENIILDVAPMIIDDRTMVPVRAVSEAFDCDVRWLGDLNTVSIVAK